MRHSGNQLIDDLPSVQILDTPVPQMAGTVLDFCRTLDLPVDEQVITVPKFSTDRVPQRLVERCFPQLAEQLVEVPTVLSYSLLQQRTAEQTIGFSGSRSWRRCSWRSSRPLPGTGLHSGLVVQKTSTFRFLMVVEKCSWSFKVSHGQGSTAVCGAENVNTPVPHGRGGRARGGLRASPRDSAHQRFVEQNMLTLLFFTVEIFTASPRDRVLWFYPRTEFHSVCH